MKNNRRPLLEREKLCTVSIPCLQLKATLYYLGDKVGYRIWVDGKVLFRGYEYRPSPMHAINSLDSAMGLLAFHTYRPGDIEESYFKDCSNRALDWLKTIAPDDLSSFVQDYEEHGIRKGIRYYNFS